MIVRKRSIKVKKPKTVKLYFGYIIGLFLINSNRCIYYTEHGHWRDDIAGAAIFDKSEFDKVFKRINAETRKFKQVFVCKCRYYTVLDKTHWNYRTNKYGELQVKKFKSLTRFHPFQALEHLVHKL